MLREKLQNINDSVQKSGRLEQIWSEIGEVFTLEFSRFII